MVDPLTELRQAARRPAAPPNARVGVPGLPSSLPGQPGYYERIPPPDGPALGEVDQSGLPVIAEEPSPLLLPPPFSRVAVAAPPQRRVVVYCGRGADYVVSVEESADEEALYSKKYNLATLLPILDVVRALGVKVIDRTGGELQADEINLRASREQGPTRSPAHGPRGEGEPADWAPVSLYANQEQSG